MAEVSRVLTGFVFIFSGFVKAVDPWGYTYKIMDYLEAFGMSFLDPLALVASFFISALEFALGLCVLLGIYRRFHSIVLLSFMSFMTVLTLYLAIANPVKDCGCFGDALVISNWETFFKNIVLLLAALALFRWYKHTTPVFLSRKAKPWAVGIPWVFILAVSFYCYLYLPILDFRPYKIGNNITQLMEIPEDAPTDEYDITFIYSKDGVEQKFTTENYPKTDDWEFVERIDKLVKKGYEPPISDFEIYNEEGEDITDIILDDFDYTFLLVAWRLEDANDSYVYKINETYDYAKEKGYSFYCLTSSPESEIENWIKETGADYPFCNVDGITLKTIIRSNPGLVLLKGGTIINKWPSRSIPIENKEEVMPLDSSTIGAMPANHDVRNILILAAVLIGLYIPVYVYELYRRSKYTKKGRRSSKSK